MVLVDLNELKGFFNALQDGRGLDYVSSESYIRIIVKVKDMFEDDSVIGAVCIYQALLREEE